MRNLLLVLALASLSNALLLPVQAGGDRFGTGYF